MLSTRTRTITITTIPELVEDLTTLITTQDFNRYVVMFRDNRGYVQINRSVVLHKNPLYRTEYYAAPTYGLTAYKSIDGLRFASIHIPGLIIKYDSETIVLNTYSHPAADITSLVNLICYSNGTRPLVNVDLERTLRLYYTDPFLSPKTPRPPKPFNLKPTLTKYFGVGVAGIILKDLN